MLRYQFGWTYRDLATLFRLSVGGVERLVLGREGQEYYLQCSLDHTHGYGYRRPLGEGLEHV